MARERQSEWPRVRDNKEACFLTPDGYQKSDRLLVGPLRFGTEPGVGPRGNAVALGRSEDRSDLGMDSVSPRDFDPMGTCRSRSGSLESDLIARQKRQGGGY